MVVKLSTSTKNSIDEEIFEYNSIVREIALRKLEIETEREHDENVGGGRNSIISKPVESIVLKYSDDPRIQYLERLRSDVEKCYNNLTKEQRVIFEMRWILNESNTWEEIAGKMHFSVKSIYRKREKILEKYAIVKGKM